VEQPVGPEAALDLPSSSIPWLIVLVLGSLVGGCSLFGSPQPSTPSPTASATTSATSGETASPTALPSPTGSPPVAVCDPATLAARITEWTGAAGHRIASVELTNAGTASCTINALSQPQLIDGQGTVLIDGAPPAPSALLTVNPGAILRTLVQDSNYCGPAPVPPVTVAFILPGGAGRILATPLTPTDTSGVPPCNGPGSLGDIEMQAWGP